MHKLQLDSATPKCREGTYMIRPGVCEDPANLITIGRSVMGLTAAVGLVVLVLLALVAFRFRDADNKYTSKPTAQTPYTLRGLEL